MSIKQAAAQHPEIVKGIAITAGAFTLADYNLLVSSLLATVGICYTLRKWYLMEKYKKNPTHPPFSPSAKK